jgi:hypothetical protein
MVKKRERVRVDREKNQVTVVFDVKFYEPESVKSSVNDFMDCCFIELESGDDYVTVVLSPKSREIEINTLGFEFYNYVLGKMRSNESRF